MRRSNLRFKTRGLLRQKTPRNDRTGGAFSATKQSPHYIMQNVL